VRAAPPSWPESENLQQTRPSVSESATGNRSIVPLAPAPKCLLGSHLVAMLHKKRRRRKDNARAPSAAGGLGGFHGAQDSLQVFSLQGPNHLEFSAARDAFRQQEGRMSSSAARRSSKATRRLAPEELLIARSNTCMMLTFLTLAQGLTPSDMKAKPKVYLRTSREISLH